MQPPIFLLAAPFCGVSRLAAMLGCHPQLYALPQLHLFMADNVGELLSLFELGQGAHADGLLRAVADIQFGAQTDDAVVPARHWLQQHAHLSGGELLAVLAARVAPRRLVIPEADSPLRPLDLLRMRRQLPDARIVQLLRHPGTQGLALAAYLRERLFVPPDFCDHSVRPARVDPQIPWLRANLNIERLLGALPPHAYRRLQSESLDQDARAALAEVCRWLQLNADDAVLAAMQHWQTWRYAADGPGLAPQGLEDDCFDAEIDAPINAPTLDAPLPWLLPQQGFAAEVVERARAYGY